MINSNNNDHYSHVKFVEKYKLPKARNAYGFLYNLFSLYGAILQRIKNIY